MPELSLRATLRIADCLLGLIESRQDFDPYGTVCPRFSAAPYPDPYGAPAAELLWEWQGRRLEVIATPRLIPYLPYLGRSSSSRRIRLRRLAITRRDGRGPVRHDLYDATRWRSAIDDLRGAVAWLREGGSLAPR